jgi:hypothetical protein
MHNGEKYQVHCATVVAEEIFQLQQSVPQSQRKRFADVFEQIVRRLQHDPNEFGEPLYHLPSLRMQVRTAVILPLAVDFAVCEDRPLVFIKSGRLLGKQAD